MAATRTDVSRNILTASPAAANLRYAAHVHGALLLLRRHLVQPGRPALPPCAPSAGARGARARRPLLPFQPRRRPPRQKTIQVVLGGNGVRLSALDHPVLLRSAGASDPMGITERHPNVLWLETIRRNIVNREAIERHAANDARADMEECSDATCRTTYFG